MRFSRAQVLRIFAIAKPRATKLLAEPGDAPAHDGEDDGFEDFRMTEPVAADEQETKARGSERSRAGPGQDRRDPRQTRWPG